MLKYVFIHSEGRGYMSEKSGKEFAWITEDNMPPAYTSADWKHFNVLQDLEVLGAV